MPLMDKTPLRDLDALLLDMDGTVYLGPSPIPGAPEFIAYLKASDRRHLFFTNNPTRDAAAYAARLTGMGIEASPDDVLTAGDATVRYLRDHTPHRRLFVLGVPSFEEQLRRAGFELTDEAPEAVVLSFDKTLTYAKLERACLLLRQGLPYFATNPDTTCPTEYGYIPDCGSMAALLQAASGREPLFIGKPSAEMARLGMEKLGVEPARTAMVGDRLYTDMEMGHRAGLTTILVLSGEATEADLAALDRRPDYVLDSVAQLHDALTA